MKRAVGSGDMGLALDLLPNSEHISSTHFFIHTLELALPDST